MTKYARYNPGERERERERLRLSSDIINESLSVYSKMCIWTAKCMVIARESQQCQECSMHDTHALVYRTAKSNN